MKTFRNDTPTARRSGFTLVELLVAAALTVLIMTVLATAFQTGMQTLSHLKSIVGLSEQLRTAESILRNDLGGVHLESALGDPVRVSDPRLASTAWVNPGRGYFSVVHGSALVPGPLPATSPNDPNFYEGIEESVNSRRATDQSLYFTTRRSGESKQDVYYGDATGLPATLGNQNLTDYVVNNSQLASKWAEIGYVLVPLVSNAVTNDEGATLAKLKLYTLNRRQRSLAPNAVALDLLPTLGAPSANPNFYVARYPEISITGRGNAIPPLNGQAQAFVNDPSTVTDIFNRLMTQWSFDAMTPANSTGFVSVANGTLFPSALAIGSTSDKYGSDVVLNNVISMQIRVITNGSSMLFLDDLPVAGVYPRRLDTANGSGTVIRAIQIKLRVWDTKNSITRQITITQDL